MGCVKSVNSKKPQTLRSESSQIQQNEPKGKESFKGKEAKEVLQDMEIDDMMIAIKTQNFQLIEALCVKYQLENVCEIRGLPGEFELLEREKYSFHYWNIVQLSLAFEDLKSLKYFTQKLECHLRMALRSPPILGFCKMKESQPQQEECFSLLVALHKRNNEILKFLWEDLRMLWDSYHLLYFIEEIANQKYVEGIKLILKSETTHEIYLAMRSKDKIEFLTTLIIKKQTKRILDIKETLKQELSQKPYATLSLFVMLNDPKGYNANKNYLESCLENLDAREYGTFKYTFQQYADYVSKKVYEYENSDTSTSQKEFGQKLKQKLDELDQKLHALEGGFVSQVDYEQILTIKLFEVAQSGNEKQFQEIVKKTDIRVFKRKRLPIVKLTSSFNINNYSYFTPLLVAIQNSKIEVARFIMKNMKIGLRQALCLEPVDGQENFMQDANEDYQVYSVLCSCSNKDEPMLRELWEVFGSYLWTDRHFECVMRYLIESGWCDGMRIVMRSKTTHSIIKALSSDDRTYFIDNILGDVFSISNEEVKTCLKEELTEQPYAGLYIIYMILNFEENFTESEIEYWNKAIKNLYFLEMNLLSKANQNLFGQFIVDIKFKRRDDQIKQASLKFIDELYKVEVYKKLIESGDEEIIQNGPEEVKMLKLDVNESPFTYFSDLIKFAITGNIKQFQKVIEQEKLTGEDLYDLRGFRVKIFDQQKKLISTRMWNPIMFAIYFRQLKILQYCVNELKVNMRIMCDKPETINEYLEDSSPLKEMLGNQDSLFGFLLAIQTRDVPILKYFYEELESHFQVDDLDVILLMKICLQQEWCQGFIYFLNSPMTDKIFMNSSKEFKCEYVQFILSNTFLLNPKDDPNEKKQNILNESQVKELNEKMTQFPYCSVSWLYFQPDDKKIRYVKLLNENFDKASVSLLAQSNQLEQIKKESIVFKPKLDISILDEKAIKDEDDKKNMIGKIEEEKVSHSKILENQQKFIQIIEKFQHEVLGRNVLSNVCDEIVENYFRKNENKGNEAESIIKLINDNNINIPLFICGFSDFNMKRNNEKYKKLRFDEMNIIQWCLFFNKHEIFQHFLNTFQGDTFHLGKVLRGNNQKPYKYKLYDINREPLRIVNIGAMVCILNKNLESWELLIKYGRGLFSVNQVLSIVQVICNEKWKAGLNIFVALIEEAFAKSSLQKRITFIETIASVGNDMMNDVLRIPKLQTFLEWMYHNDISKELLGMNAQIKKLLPSTQSNKDDEITKIKFLNRQKEKKKKNLNQSSSKKDSKKIIVDNNLRNDPDLNEIYLENDDF